MIIPFIYFWMMVIGQWSSDEFYMQRCIHLAELGAGNVAPNPMVGAVLVHEGRIIGEGYHRQHGEAHAEVNCINSVSIQDQQFIAHSVLYVSLEPCAHFGKTPPCSSLIVEKKIPKVVIGTSDPFTEVNGKGIEQLRAAGIEVAQDVLQAECIALNKRFFTFHNRHRPYIILKWAQTADDKIGSNTSKRLMVSNEYTNRLVHKWRSEESAILIGTNTALNDNPSLNVRSWKGNDPLRMVVDMDLSLPQTLKIFSDGRRTIVFNTIKHSEAGNPSYYKVTEDVSLVHQVMNACYGMKIQSVLVEGGAKLLQSFIDDGSWDEARVITNTALSAGEGLPAPILSNATALKKEDILTDRITYFAHHVSTP